MTKSIFASKTFWGAVVSLVAMFAPNLLTILGVSSQTAAVSYILAGIGFITTVYGRFKATQGVSLTGGSTAPAAKS